MLVCRFRRQPKEAEAAQVSLGDLGLRSDHQRRPRGPLLVEGQVGELGEARGLEDALLEGDGPWVAELARDVRVANSDSAERHLRPGKGISKSKASAGVANSDSAERHLRPRGSTPRSRTGGSSQTATQPKGI